MTLFLRPRHGRSVKCRGLEGARCQMGGGFLKIGIWQTAVRPRHFRRLKGVFDLPLKVVFRPLSVFGFDPARRGCCEPPTQPFIELRLAQQVVDGCGLAAKSESAACLKPARADFVGGCGCDPKPAIAGGAESTLRDSRTRPVAAPCFAARCHPSHRLLASQRLWRCGP